VGTDLLVVKFEFLPTPLVRFAFELLYGGAGESEDEARNEFDLELCDLGFMAAEK
jgi:hypothetical protein